MLNLTKRMTPVQVIYLTDQLNEIFLRKWLYSESLNNIFQLTATEALSNYNDRFVKIRVVFHAIYFENEVGDPPVFLHF